MKVILAKTAGFCMGVRRAMEIAQDAAKDSASPVYTHGELIHNKQAIDVLENQGIKAVKNFDDIAKGKMVIRAHGVPKAVKDELTQKGFECIDATCPHVLKSQKRIEKDSAEGKAIVIVGDHDHAEMVGLAGHASNDVHIISTEEEAEKLSISKDFSVIAQTTFNAETYEKICDIFNKRYPNCTIYHSICRATEERQNEAMRLANECDALVVVGGKHSANTCRLAEIGRIAGKPTFHIETAEELNPDEISGFNTVAVTAGASTPGWLTQTVIDKLIKCDNKGIIPVIRKTLDIVIRSYMYNAIGGICLSFAMAKLMNVFLTLNHVAVVFSYILSIYIFNRYAVSSKNSSSVSGIFNFYTEHKTKLLSISVFLSIASILLSLEFSRNLFALIIFAYVAGIIYTIPILPKTFRYRCLKDIPASKDIFVSLAWAALLTAIPAYFPLENAAFKTTAGIFTLVFLLIFGKTVALDLRDTEGDRLIGSETIPVLIGKNKTIKLLYAVQFIIFALTIILTYLSIFSIYGYGLCLVPIYGIGYLRLFRKRLLKDEIKCQAIVDGQIIFAGIITLITRYLIIGPQQF